MARVEFRDTDDRLDYAQQEATAAGLSAAQVAHLQGFLLGATLTHFDESPVVPMTDARWRRIVQDGVAEALRPASGGE